LAGLNLIHVCLYSTKIIRLSYEKKADFSWNYIIIIYIYIYSTCISSYMHIYIREWMWSSGLGRWTVLDTQGTKPNMLLMYLSFHLYINHVVLNIYIYIYTSEN
jgi:hypothetical protein